jgi:hypothetical protein
VPLPQWVADLGYAPFSIGWPIVRRYKGGRQPAGCWGRRHTHARHLVAVPDSLQRLASCLACPRGHRCTPCATYICLGGIAGCARGVFLCSRIPLQKVVGLDFARSRPNMPKQDKKSLYRLLVKKKQKVSLLHGIKLTDAYIAELEMKLQGAKQRKRTKVTKLQEAQRMMAEHLTGAMKTCFVQQNAIFEVILAVHPLSKEPALGRLMMSFLCSTEIKALRSTCRAMTCFVHVHCEEIATPRNLYIGKDRAGWKQWGKRFVLEFKA